MKIGIDLGTANVLVYVKGRGIVISEPSVVAVSEDNRIVAVGEEARQMIGRTPGHIRAIRPMKDGVIADYVITEFMLSHFIGKIRKRRVGFSGPQVMIAAPGEFRFQVRFLPSAQPQSMTEPLGAGTSLLRDQVGTSVYVVNPRRTVDAGLEFEIVVKAQ